MPATYSSSESRRESVDRSSFERRFELIPDSAAAAGIVLAESTLSCSKGGKFMIDLTGNSNSTPSQVNGRATPSFICYRYVVRRMRLHLLLCRPSWT